jgi:hypothetical protein
MAANKQIIFDIGNNKVADLTKPQLGQQPIKPSPKSPLLKRSKTSNLGVRVSIKQITKSPVPVILPSTQPNQPVIALGKQIPPVGVLGLGNPPQAPNFNPAIKHPVVINNPPITNNTTYIPEQTHPAILPATAQIATKIQPRTTQRKTTPEKTTQKKITQKKTNTQKNKTNTQKNKTNTQKNKTNRIFNI